MKKVTLILLMIFFAVSGLIFILGSLNRQNNSNTALNQNTIINTNSSSQTNTSPTTNTPTTNSTPTFTLADISSHNIRSNCYLAINNNVYDVSSYISFHPGGSSSITSNCGKEVTGIFSRIHSNRAWDLLAKYKIGVLSN